MNHKRKRPKPKKRNTWTSPPTKGDPTVEEEFKDPPKTFHKAVKKKKKPKKEWIVRIKYSKLRGAYNHKYDSKKKRDQAYNQMLKGYSWLRERDLVQITKIDP